MKFAHHNFGFEMLNLSCHHHDIQKRIVPVYEFVHIHIKNVNANIAMRASTKTII